MKYRAKKVKREGSGGREMVSKVKEEGPTGSGLFIKLGLARLPRGEDMSGCGRRSTSG
jgi:hypothetical protein